MKPSTTTALRRELKATRTVAARGITAVTMAVGTTPTKPAPEIVHDLVAAEMKKGGPLRGR